MVITSLMVASYLECLLLLVGHELPVLPHPLHALQRLLHLPPTASPSSSLTPTGLSPATTDADHHSTAPFHCHSSPCPPPHLLEVDDGLPLLPLPCWCCIRLRAHGQCTLHTHITKPILTSDRHSATATVTGATKPSPYPADVPPRHRHLQLRRQVSVVRLHAIHRASDHDYL